MDCTADGVCANAPRVYTPHTSKSCSRDPIDMEEFHVENAAELIAMGFGDVVYINGYTSEY